MSDAHWSGGAPTETQRAEPTRIAGLATWTNNAAESRAATAKIVGLWARFTSEGWFDHLERVGAVGPPVAVYTGYKTDASGDYHVVVGRDFPPASGAPPGVELVRVPAGRYLVFAFEGTVPDVVIHGWRQVWTFFSQPRQLRRAYTADLEMYHADGAGVDIWIAVR